MKLHRQLFLISLLLLSLPWSGCQYIKEIESALRFGQEQSLLSTAQAIASVLENSPQQMYPFPERRVAAHEADKQIYFEPLSNRIILDGYDEEWVNSHSRELESEHSDLAVSYRAVVKEEQLFLFFDVKDREVVYHDYSTSLKANGDRIVLVTGKKHHFVLTTSAPGRVTAHYQKTPHIIVNEPAIRSYWQEKEGGYSVEVALPIAMTLGKLGFYIVNKDRNSHVDEIIGTVSNKKNIVPPWFVYLQPELSDSLAIFKKQGLHFKVLDQHHWVIAQAGEIEPRSESKIFWLIRVLYRSILKNQGVNQPVQPVYGQLIRSESKSAMTNQSAVAWYKDERFSNQSVLSVAVPIVVEGEVIGAVVAEQSSEQFLSLTDKAFNRLLFYSFIALSFTGLGLLGYASWLSFRVRRLSRAAETVLSDDGTILDNFPKSRMRDEIGDLTRSYRELLKRIGEYTDYLRSLSRKLSHELRTPLAIIHTSLDNLKHQASDTESEIYQKRAKEGALRLSNILTSMSEASRVEESIQTAEFETTDIGKLLRELTAAYRDVYRNHRIQFIQEPQKTVELPLAPELIVQMLDKLIDNAVDFCPVGGLIVIELVDTEEGIFIRVKNEGPPLPENMQSQLFDNMVSMRNRRDTGETTHLGLGLHIVRLIVEFHKGKVKASNLADQLGVCFEIELPV